ncbi:MAG TPA: amidohydrolase, partial [Cytophagaceae bacterium]
IQTTLHWEEPEANRSMLEEKLWQIKEPTDLVILPEMFTTGFSMDAEKLAEPMNLTTFKWMKQQAAQLNAVVTGSYIVKENNNFYNRLIWMQPDGNFYQYDKRHLFRMAGEHHVYASGDKRLVVELKGWKICPLICYDLRFPAWSRNRHLEYDLLLYIANWPEPRVGAWNALLQARAIENLCYVAGVNRVGEDGKGLYYSGDSALINPKGERVFHEKDKEVLHTETLSRNMLDSFREKFPAHLDADDFSINL